MNRLWVRIFAAHLAVLALVTGAGALLLPRLVYGYFYREAQTALVDESRQVVRLLTELVDWQREEVARERFWFLVRRLANSEFLVFGQSGDLIASKSAMTPRPPPALVQRAMAERREVRGEIDLPAPAGAAGGAPRPAPRGGQRTAPDGDARGESTAAALAVPLQRDGRVVGALLMYRPLARAEAAAGRVVGLFARVALVGVGASLLGSLWLARTLTRPLSELERAAERIARGDLSSRAAVLSRDEVGAVARSFNAMAERVEAAVGALREQEAKRREFMAAISHELRTPLTSVRGFVRALRDRVDPDPGAHDRHLAIVDQETAQIQRLVEDLFQFAKLEAGQVSLHLAPVALAPYLADFAARARQRAEAAGVRWRADVPAELGVAMADRDRLNQILLNLVDNAVRHTPSGGEAGITATADAGRVRISVWDTGPGVPPDERERIFEKFYQGPAGQRRPAGGMGLGLAIARGLAQQHGGDVELEPSERGARFALVLPLSPPAGSGRRERASG